MMTINEALEVLRKYYGCRTTTGCASLGDLCSRCEYDVDADTVTEALKTVLDNLPTQMSGTSEDTISRQAAIDTIMNTDETCYIYWKTYYKDLIEALPSAQPKITDEQAIKHLQSTGWMQNHDREMYESGIRECLSDDRGSYDSLIPETHECDYEELDFVQKHKRIPITLVVQTHGDVISRAEAINALKGLPTWWADAGGYYGDAQPPMTALLDPEDAISAIENLPSVQAEQKITHCENCKHRHLEKDVWTCPFGLPGGPKFFCGYGSDANE